MLKRNRLLAVAFLLILFAAVSGGCAHPEPATVPLPPEQGPAPAQEETQEETIEQFYEVGIVQLAEHPALDDARSGTIDALADAGYIEGENINIHYKNAQGDPLNADIINRGFAADQVDLIIAITLPALQSAAAVTQDIPIIFNSGTDPQAAGVIESWERPNTNVTGVSDLSPVKEALELILEIQPDSISVGVIYNTGEVNSVRQVDIARHLAPELGIEIVESTVLHTGEVEAAAEALVGKVDAVFLPTDNTALTSFSDVLNVTEKNNILVVGSATEFAELGAVAAIGFNYYDLGYQSGIMAAAVLKGANPAKMPIQLSTRVIYAINETAAQNIDMELPQALLNRAELKY